MKKFFIMLLALLTLFTACGKGETVKKEVIGPDGKPMNIELNVKGTKEDAKKIVEDIKASIPKMDFSSLKGRVDEADFVALKEVYAEGTEAFQENAKKIFEHGSLKLVSEKEDGPSIVHEYEYTFPDVFFIQENPMNEKIGDEFFKDYNATMKFFAEFEKTEDGLKLKNAANFVGSLCGTNAETSKSSQTYSKRIDKLIEDAPTLKQENAWNTSKGATFTIQEIKKLSDSDIPDIELLGHSYQIICKVTIPKNETFEHYKGRFVILNAQNENGKDLIGYMPDFDENDESIVKYTFTSQERPISEMNIICAFSSNTDMPEFVKYKLYTGDKKPETSEESTPKKATQEEVVEKEN